MTLWSEMKLTHMAQGMLETAGSQENRLHRHCWEEAGHTLPKASILPPISTTDVGLLLMEKRKKEWGERPGKWSCYTNSTWKDEGQRKMFPLFSDNIFLPQLQWSFQRYLLLLLPETVESSHLSDSNHAPQKEDSLSILLSTETYVIQPQVPCAHTHTPTHTHKQIHPM